MATQAAFMPGTQAKEHGVLWSWLTTVDHKRIGILYGVTAFTFFLIGGIEALIMRLQLARPDNTVVSAQTFNELFTMHGTTMVFFVGMPILIGIGNYLVPLMIGARDMAFPRMNAFGFWVTLFGGLVLYFSFVVPGGAPAMGWFAYAPLTERTFARGPGTDLWALSHPDLRGNARVRALSDPRTSCPSSRRRAAIPLIPLPATPIKWIACRSSVRNF
jgi:heme/copper-type cytochrome/quinol oxidase subunit 1